MINIGWMDEAATRQRGGRRRLKLQLHQGRTLCVTSLESFSPFVASCLSHTTPRPGFTRHFLASHLTLSPSSTLINFYFVLYIVTKSFFNPRIIKFL